MKTNLNSHTMSVQVINHVYENNPVTFKVNGNVMINATQMAKPFGLSKRPVQWLRYQQSQEFLSELLKVRNHTLTDNEQITPGCRIEYGGLVIIRKGGSNPGTWLHEDVAIEFARWLSPAFAIWCNDRIKEILLSNLNPVNDLESKDKEIARLKKTVADMTKAVESANQSNTVFYNDFLRHVRPDGRFKDINLYLFAVLKAFVEFLHEEVKAHSYSELRLIKKIEASQTLFPEDRLRLGR